MKLGKEFFRQSATIVAPALIGKTLHYKGQEYMIIETECYFGEEDTACHAYKGRTKRTELLYAEGGIIYMYLCYGIHSMLNFVTGEENHPEGVLIRGLEGLSGPGKLTKSIGITMALHGEDLTSSDDIWLEDTGAPCEYEMAPRIGIGYASPEDQAKLWRYIKK